jgi:hypothetical protein
MSRVSPTSTASSPAGKGPSISDSTTKTPGRAGGAGGTDLARSAAAVFAGVLLCFSSASAVAATTAGADSAQATLRVETKPTGLVVVIDGTEAGHAPLVLRLFAKTVRVRAVPGDPRLFSLAPVERTVALVPGATVEVTLDLRPPISLASVPEAASVFLGSGSYEAPDSLAGQTPLSILPSVLDPAFVRLSSPAYADTTLRGDALVAAAAGGAAFVRMRQISPILPGKSSSHPTPLYRRGWFQWSLIGIGAALSVSSIVFHNEADTWYERYLGSSDPEQIPYYYDQANQYDHLATVSLAVGQISLLGGLLLLITNPSH